MAGMGADPFILKWTVLFIIGYALYYVLIKEVIKDIKENHEDFKEEVVHPCNSHCNPSAEYSRVLSERRAIRRQERIKAARGKNGGMHARVGRQ